jgi:hypothetical protein
MSKQITINDSFYKKIGGIKAAAEEKVKDRAEAIVDYAVSISPVDTGAYVESFSVVPRGAGGGRMRSSKGRAKAPNPIAVKEQEAARLKSDLDKIDIVESGGFVLRNRAPHANSVETGEGWPRKIKRRKTRKIKHTKKGYYVFLKTKDRFR